MFWLILTDGHILGSRKDLVPGLVADVKQAGGLGCSSGHGSRADFDVMFNAEVHAVLAGL